MEIEGKVKFIGETETFGSNGFRKRSLVLTTDEQYPQTIEVEFVQDKTSLLDKFAEGQNVKVSINIRGREWKNPEGIVKYFNSIQGWRIEAGSGAVANTSTQAPPVTEEPTDDLPF